MDENNLELNSNLFKKGTNVKIIIDDEKTLKVLQKGHGGWHCDIMKYIGLSGLVHSYTDTGDVRVIFEGCINTWTLNPQVLEKVEVCEVWENLENFALLELLRDNKKYEVDTRKSNLVNCVIENRQNVIENYFLTHNDEHNLALLCLHTSCVMGHEEIVKFFIKIGIEVNCPDGSKGRNSLHWAVIGDQEKILNLLINNQGDEELKDKEDCTPFHLSIIKSRPNAFNFLMGRCDKKLINIESIHHRTPVMDAIHRGNLDMVSRICKSPYCTFNTSVGYGCDVLHLAAMQGDRKIMECLLKNPKLQSRIDEKKVDGFAAIHLASLNNHLEALKLLIEYGADLELRNNQGKTAIQIASRMGHHEIVEYFVSIGADANTEDFAGENCLHVIFGKKFKEGNLLSLDAKTEIGQLYLQLRRTYPNVENCVKMALAYFLMLHGCDELHCSKRNVKPIDLLTDQNLKNIFIDKKLKIEKSSDGNNDLKSIYKSSSNPLECKICTNLIQDYVTLKPCEHFYACENCSSLLKRCLICGIPIEGRMTKDGRNILPQTRMGKEESLRYLEAKIKEVEERLLCCICHNGKKEVAFLCGHASCQKCSAVLKTCHICRSHIGRRIFLY